MNRYITETNENKILPKNKYYNIAFDRNRLYIIIYIDMECISVGYYKSGSCNIIVSFYGKTENILEMLPAFITKKWLAKNATLIFDEIVIAKIKNHPISDNKILSILAPTINTTFDKFIDLPAHGINNCNQATMKNYVCQRLAEMI